jgi:hypothetical protein
MPCVYAGHEAASQHEHVQSSAPAGGGAKAAPPAGGDRLTPAHAMEPVPSSRPMSSLVTPEGSASMITALAVQK